MKSSKIILYLANETDAQLISDLLCSHGHNVLRITVPEHEIKNEIQCDLIIVDKFTGQLACEKLSVCKNKSNIFLPILILLDSNEPADPWLQKCFDDVIRIPISKTELLVRINVFLRLRNQSKEAIKQSEEIYKAIFEATGTATLIVDENTDILMANAQCYDVLGYKPEELMGRKWTQYAAPDSLELMFHYHTLRRINPDLAPKRYEVKIFHKNGELRDIVLDISMIPNTKQSVVSMLDITEQKKATELIRESEEKFRMAFHTSPDSININRLEDGVYVDINEGFTRITGYSREDVVGRSSLELNIWKNPKDRSRLVAGLKEKGEVQNMEAQFVMKDGTIRDGLMSAAIITLNKIPHIISITRDITERKKAEQKIFTLSKAIEQSPVAIAIANSDGKIEYINQAFSDLTQFNTNELLNTHFVNFFNKIFIDKSSFDNTVHAILKGDIWVKEHQIYRKDGEIIWVQAIASCIFDSNGNVSNYLLIMEDISERKQMYQELIIAKEKAEESDRLKTAFLHNISHEIRTPMNAIVGFSEFLRDETLPLEKRKHYTDIIIRSGQQLLSIINDIISIATIEAGQEKLYLSETDINDICRLLYDQYLPKAEFQKIKLLAEVENLNTPHIILTDSTKLSQVLSNLLANAIKFTHKGSITYGYRLIDNQIEFFVRDTGIGIPENMLNEIFKRFRQVRHTGTKLYGGSGLGLSISKAYVELMGGKIWVESEEDKGSTFYFTIPYTPLIKANTDETNHAAITLHKKDKDLKVLVAEDDDTNYFLLEEILHLAGIETIRAITGLEVIDLLLKNTDIKLILMDIKLPELDGLNATREAKKINPSIPIIAQTAFAQKEDKERALKAGCDDYISKPIDKDELLKKINKLVSI